MKTRRAQFAILFLLLAGSFALAAQQAPLMWTPFGNASVVAGVAGIAAGPVERVWRDGNAIWIALPTGETVRTVDLQRWESVAAGAVPAAAGEMRRLRGAGISGRVLSHPMDATRRYAIADQVYRSDDAGESYSGLTQYREISLVGDQISDLALNPNDPDDLLLATELGLWRSRDGGLSWYHASSTLANLPLRRIASFPRGTRGLRVETPDGRLLEWIPGAVHGYRNVSGEAASRPASLRVFGSQVRAWDAVDGQVYGSLRDGRLIAARDGVAGWREFALPGWGAARQIVANPMDDRMALALAQNDAGQMLLLRTLNGGVFWEDWTPPGMVRAEAIAVDWERGAVFVLQGQQLLLARGDLRSMSRLSVAETFAADGLNGPVVDLRVDPSGTALFAVTQREGIFTAPLPSLAGAPRIRNAADLSAGAAAPGSLLSLHGTAVAGVRANGRDAAVLGGAENATQVQLPYGLAAGELRLDLETTASEQHSLRVPLRRTAPAIFLHPDGNPFVLHAENGVLMDENNPVSPGERIHILLAGLGQVTPDWPAGMVAPAENPPSVVAAVEATVNGVRIPVRSATLAPGYAGIYLVELVLPNVMDEGITELQVMVDGAMSNPVPVHVRYEAAPLGDSIIVR